MKGVRFRGNNNCYCESVHQIKKSRFIRKEPRYAHRLAGSPLGGPKTLPYTRERNTRYGKMAQDGSDHPSEQHRVTRAQQHE